MYETKLSLLLFSVKQFIHFNKALMGNFSDKLKDDVPVDRLPPCHALQFEKQQVALHFTSKPKPQHNKVSLILCHSHPKKTAYSSSALSLRMPQRELQPLYTVYRTLWSCFMREQWSSVPAFHPTLQIQALASASGLFFGCPSRHTETHRFPSHLQHSGGSPGRKTNWRAWGE